MNGYPARWSLRSKLPRDRRQAISGGSTMNRILIAFLALAGATGAHAQIGLGADVVSRYVWRGKDFGDAVSVQPYLSYTAGPVKVATWACVFLSNKEIQPCH